MLAAQVISAAPVLEGAEAQADSREHSPTGLVVRHGQECCPDHRQCRAGAVHQAHVLSVMMIIDEMDWHDNETMEAQQKSTLWAIMSVDFN